MAACGQHVGALAEGLLDRGGGVVQLVVGNEPGHLENLHAVKVDGGVLVVMEAHGRLVEGRAVVLEGGADPDVGGVPRCAHHRPGSLLGAEAGGAFLPAGVVKVGLEPFLGRLLDRVSPGDGLLRCRGQQDRGALTQRRQRCGTDRRGQDGCAGCPRQPRVARAMSLEVGPPSGIEWGVHGGGPLSKDAK